jgi:hypothetical protein
MILDVTAYTNRSKVRTLKIFLVISDIFYVSTTQLNSKFTLDSFLLGLVSTNKIRNSAKVRFQVLTATSIKMSVFWDVAPCSLVEL